MLTPINAVDKPVKTAAELILTSADNSRGGLRAQEGEHAIDASPRGHRISKREARCK